MQAFHADAFAFPLPPRHVFPLAKYRLLRERIAAWPAATGIELSPAPRARRDELLLVHDAGYVDDFLAGRLPAEHMARIGFPWSPEFVERTLRSCGATLAATRAALRHGAAVHLAGGTHHARVDRGAGYCVFHDCAIGTRIVQREAGIDRVLVVDTDVHQGDGTAAIFADDERVYTFSIHGAQNFPAAKVQSDLDVALPDRTGDVDYLEALAPALATAFAASRPGFVFWISGADPFAGDRFGRLGLSKAGLLARDRMVVAAMRSRGVPFVTVMGGGYAREVGDTVDIHEATVRAVATG
ncbi:MAG: histone deacetylase [Planctomycetes bacterium]|nr:histone deacetylase [Planctomycetota bacterium]